MEISLTSFIRGIQSAKIGAGKAAGFATAVAIAAKSSIQSIPAAIFCIAGAGLMAEAGSKLTTGKILDGSQCAIAGLLSLESGSYLTGLQPGQKDQMVCAGVLTAAAASTCLGIKKLYSAVVEKSASKLLQGAAAVAGGALAIAVTAKSQLQSIPVIAQATAIALFCCQITFLGLTDVTKGRCLKGLGKMILGGTGIGIAGYCAYLEFMRPSNFAPELPDSFTCNRKIRIATVYDNQNNPKRQAISDLTTENHRKYAVRWNATHDVITKSLVSDKCENPFTHQTENCSPYWNKIKYFKNWCEQSSTSNVEEWGIYLDDDAVITNGNISPCSAIDALRAGQDTSFIIATEGRGTRSRPGAVNTGVMIVRRDPKGCGVIDRIWANRDYVTNLSKMDCPTYGLCKDQSNGDEQGATDKVFYRDAPELIDRDVTRLLARDETHPTRGHIAFNTVHRDGCFRALRRVGSLSSPHNILKSDLEMNPAGIWRPRDWIGQTAGYPLEGQDLSHQPSDQCKEDPTIPVGPIRIKKVQQMLSQTI